MRRTVLLVVALLAGCASGSGAKRLWTAQMEQAVAGEAGDVKASAVLGDHGFTLDVHNVGAGSIRILWDESSYVDPSGNANRVIHEGVRLVTRDAPQAPSAVPAGAHLRNAVVPANKINLSDNGTWTAGWMISFDEYSSTSRKAWCDRPQPATFTLNVVFERDGVRSEVPLVWKMTCAVEAAPQVG